MEADTKRYPRKVEVRKGLVVEIKPLKTNQIDDLMELYWALDEKAVAKLSHDVNGPHYPRSVKRRMEDKRVYYLVAWNQGKIIGSLALYHGESLWSRHIGHVVFVSHPEYRRYGIATILFDEVLPLAESLGIEKLYAELTREHSESIKMLKNFGFTREATLKDHIKDRYGRYRDMRIYSLDTEKAHREMEALISEFSDYSG